MDSSYDVRTIGTGKNKIVVLDVKLDTFNNFQYDCLGNVANVNIDNCF